MPPRRATKVQDLDMSWAQNVIDRWSVKKSVPAPSVTTIAMSKEIPLSGYIDSTIIVNEEAWIKHDMMGKILLLADGFTYHLQCTSGAEFDKERAFELTTELVLLEVELWSDATGVRATGLMKIKSISKLMSLLRGRPAGR